MTTDTPTALNELADRIPRSHRRLADEPLAETSRHVRAATVHVIVAFDGSPAGRTPWRWARYWRAQQAPSCSWFASFRRSHSPGSRSTHEPRGSPTAITGSSYGRMRRPCSVKRERRCHPTSLSRFARSSASPLDVDCVSWPSPRPRTCSCSAQRVEGRSDGCCIAAWSAACYEIRRVRSPSSAAILAVVLDRCRDSPNAWPAAGGQPAGRSPDSPGTARKKGCDAWPSTADTYSRTSRTGRSPAARWRIVSISNERAVVDLCTCTGEPMERLESDDPAVIAHLRTTHSILDLN